mmetsp:Transcript_20718/g.23652  ORF Transcript_20718/g.23652 Transcript_20718/m.23652 type:complete len:662 (+) Transcript_20718:118-2103(+)
MDHGGTTSNVRVGIRLKPFTKEDASSTVISGLSSSTTNRSSCVSISKKRNYEGNHIAWRVKNGAIEHVSPARKVEGKSSFVFDHIFEEESTNFQIYNAMIRPVVREVVDGKNGTVFCYGQTGSGKTFTMQGSNIHKKKNDGILSLAARDIIQWTNEFNESDFKIRVSYFEIYNEKVRDLLSDAKLDINAVVRNHRQSESSFLKIRDDPKRGVRVNCREIEVKGFEAIMNLLRFGNRGRTKASTRMNVASSRSHSNFRVTLETFVDAETVRSATLNLVDLAGSENTYLSDLSTRKNTRECGKINSSLLSLSRVINALSQPPSRRPKYINYRDSNLTRILQPQLSGNTMMAILCCVSPDSIYSEETRSTLRFASRAKLVKTKASKNCRSISDDSSSALVQHLKEQLDLTRQAIIELESRNLASQESSKNTKEELQRMKMLMFGDKEVNLNPSYDIETIINNRRVKKNWAELLIPTIQEVNDPNDELDTPLGRCQLSPLSFQRVTKRREMISTITNTEDEPPSPPKEVFIMTEDPALQYNYGNDNLSSMYVLNIEQRAKFLEDRLGATEDLVEALNRDLSGAKNAMTQLVYRNIKLGSKIEKLIRKLDTREELAHRQRRSRYNLLKWSIYCSIFFFFFQQHDLYIVTVLFIWLSLESYTVKKVM